MLINTVILLLRDGLPIVFMLVLLLVTMRRVQTKSDSTRWLVKAIFITTFVTTILLTFIDTVAHWYDGMGIELLFSLAFISVYILILTYLFASTVVKQQKLKYNSAIGIFVIVVSVNTINFLVYLTGFWSQTELLISILTGMLLGVGICVSVGILLYFLLQLNAQRIQIRINNLLLLIFGCGQLTQALHLLSQIDLLPATTAVWDSGFLINENSELGYFFTALVGYDARPTGLHISLYIFALLLPIAFYYGQKRYLNTTPHQEHN